MKAEELRKKDKKELQRMVREEKERLRNLKFDLSSGKIKNIKEIGSAKKTIARILTLLKEK